ncbi:2-oxoglutarate and iron-dependent oxygenase JMJD4 [Tribolium castaneum]|uniref:2-oxoglutarate and iron-dependent oxygenase JMJD4 n=1 Tax=Tribolium castaneum TaxID=7070 RepID=UPI0001DCC192|nr:PREDICTED: jmjC domain-containing protein 4 [Tribolium castaneum]|eukprot:XP_008193873.1 PREDICTED: jmjC domain-containing protein 4 [Tribolium castaneum]
MEFDIETCDICTKNYFKPPGVPILNKELSYEEFFHNFMRPNVPCVIKNITEDWEAHYKWLNEEKAPNLDYLKDKYGNCDVTIYNCSEKYFNSQKTQICKLDSFLNKWNSAENKSKYLKDWHLKNTFKNDNFYTVPIYFASDWLNEYLTENSEDDYRFVYIGQAGTWTPFHADVFNSYSWSANVCGRKKWIFFPPGEENFLRDSLNNLPYDISDMYHTRQHFELIQNAGEAVFVPTGWYHQVWNLEDTISVNHNWVNGCNILKMWETIEYNLKCVKKEIEDCCDMEGFLQHCQVMLKASFGMDFYKFYDFLKFIALKRLAQVHKKQKEELFHGHILGLNHAFFDLLSVKTVLELFCQHCDVTELFGPTLSEMEKIIEEIAQKRNSIY